MPTDLFGEEIAEPKPRLTRNGKHKRDETPKGYAAPPGTGPMGQVCKGCKHFVRRELNKTYFKCLLTARQLPRQPGRPSAVSVTWSGCYASDIRANSPACKFWTMPDPIEWEEEHPKWR